MTKKVLLLGGSGLLGGHLQRTLQQDPELQLILPPRRSSSHQFDLTQRPALMSLLEQSSPDLIVNLIAATSVDQCEKDPTWGFRLNAELPSLLKEWQGDHSATWVIHLSTDMVYDGPGEHVENEIQPLNLYAITKRAGEMALHGPKGIVLRTNFFGPSLREGRQSFTDWLYQNFKTKSQLRLFRDVEFSPLNLQTLSKQIHRCIRQPKAGLYNLGSRNGMSKADFALRFAALFNHPLESHSILIDSDEAGLSAKRPRGMKMQVAHFENTFETQLPSLDQEIELCRSQYAPI